MVEGPFDTVDLGGGTSTGLYLLRYDTDGSLLSPRTQGKLLEELPHVSDVFVFSHGWNNDFAVAAKNYKRFIQGFVQQGSGGCTPLLVGVVWPSTSLLMPWEEGPQIAAGPDPASPEAMTAFVAGSLDQDARAQLSELVEGTDSLDQQQARTAAQLLLEGLTEEIDPDGATVRPTVDEVLTAWAALDGQAAPKPADPDDFGEVAAATEAGQPQVAGLLGNLDPRNLLRMASLWKMKDRAGKVGAHGVSPLLQKIQSSSQARVHLIGHSFGARVMLSALCFGPLSRPVRSVLLLQPAINRWCFANDVVGKHVPGGYHAATDRVELPIFTTRSTRDMPLHEVFHLAVRGSNLGEPDIAAVGDTFRFGALGGYGPGGADAITTVQPVRPVGTPYDLTGEHRLVVVDGSGDIGGRHAIGGHSDINKDLTWWALRCLVTAP